MYPCGSDDLFCPSESVAPIQVHSGFYTTFQWSEGCKPGNIPSTFKFINLLIYYLLFIIYCLQFRNIS